MITKWAGLQNIYDVNLRGNSNPTLFVSEPANHSSPSWRKHQFREDPGIVL